MKCRPFYCLTASLLVFLTSAGATPQTQSVDAGAIFRVFLKTGQALPSYGESATVGDRVVFTLLVGAVDALPSVQLMSLPADRVDLVRTRRYADAMRAKHYAATRGEVDYAAMTQEVQRTLAQLTSIEDPKKRLELAEEAKRRLLAWSAGTYGYRAADVRELSALFDEVITQLRAAAGQKEFALDLRAGPQDAPPEALLAPPTLSESLTLALEAARAADGEADRLAVLRAAESLASRPGVSPDVSTTVRRELETESRTEATYASLFSAVRARAESARRRGDVAGVEAAIETLHAVDVELGARRAATVAAVAGELSAVLDATRTYRAALDRYARIRVTLLQYERDVRTVMSGLDGLGPVLTALREQKYTAYERLERSSARLRAFRASLGVVTPPAELVDVHATLDSALKMADYACTRRRLAMSIQSEVMDREASSSAAGALLLSSLAREQLVARLYPPKIK